MNQIRIEEEDSGREEREEESAVEKVMIGKVEVSKIFEKGYNHPRY